MTAAFLVAVFAAGWCVGLLAGFAFGVWQLAFRRKELEPKETK